MKATNGWGILENIEDCYIKIGEEKIIMNNLPDIGDSKSASYSEETIQGRSTPFKNYSHSDARSISWTCHFFVQTSLDVQRILGWIKLLESCVYPVTEITGGGPYAPPVICQIKCGRQIAEDEVCVVLKSYNIKFDANFPWDQDSLLPYKTDVSLEFEVVYNQSRLPGAERIMDLGA